MSAKDIVLAAAGGGQTTTAIQYVGGKTVTITPSSASNTTISLTDLTGSPSTSLQAGDIVIVSYVIASVGTDTPNVTSNTYTTLASLFANDSNDTNLYVGYKIMGATPDTSVGVTPTRSTSNGGVVAIQAYRYCDSNFPIQQPANTATFLSTVRPTPPTITPWDNDSVAVIVGAGSHERGNVSYTTTGLTSFITSGSTNTSNDASIGMGFRVIQSGSYSPNRFGFSQSDSTAYSSAGASIALKPKPDTPIPTFISYRGSGTTTSAASVTVTKPTDVQANDLLLLTISFQGSGGTINSVPSGFTFVRSDLNSGDSITYTYKKIATSSEPASYVISGSGGGDYSCVISVFRNANTINTLGAARTTTGSTYAPSMTPTVGGLAVIVFMSDSQSTTLVTAPAGTTTLVNFAGSGSGTSQFIFSANAGAYFATPQRNVVVSTSGTYSITFQLQITQE
jgi:hypothetical protein